MRALTASLALLIGCTGNSYNQGNEQIVTNDTGDTSDTDTPGGDSGDTNDTDDTGETKPEPCENPWQPVHKTGWTKTFSATGGSGAGTGVEESLGLIEGPDGEYVYQYTDSLMTTNGSDGYSGTITVGCDYDGQEGMSVLRWEGEYFTTLGGFIPVNTVFTAEPLPAQKYLPAEWEIGAVGGWEYSYDMEVFYDLGKGKMDSFYQTVTGEFLEGGMETMTLFDGTEVEAYKLVHSFSITADFGLGSQETSDGYVEQHWVKGLGLVKEVFEDELKSKTLMEKELSGYSGLTIE